MSAEIVVPAGARGRPGLVACLGRVRQPHEGRMVAVRCPLGLVQALNATGPEVFAWRVVSLCGPVAIHGQDEREFAVAEECLVPIGQLDPELVDAYAIELAQPRFDAAVLQATQSLDADVLDEESFDRMLLEAAKIALDNHRRGFVGLQIFR